MNTFGLLLWFFNYLSALMYDDWDGIGWDGMGSEETDTIYFACYEYGNR